MAGDEGGVLAVKGQRKDGEGERSCVGLLLGLCLGLMACSIRPLPSFSMCFWKRGNRASFQAVSLQGQFPTLQIWGIKIQMQASPCPLDRVGTGAVMKRADGRKGTERVFFKYTKVAYNAFSASKLQVFLSCKSLRPHKDLCKGPLINGQTWR